MSSTQGTSKDNLPVLHPQKACAHNSCSFSRNSTPHFHCPYCGIGARKVGFEERITNQTNLFCQDVHQIIHPAIDTTHFQQKTS